MPVGPYTQIISDEIFTDRQEFLDRWFQRILGTPQLTLMSHALVGRRRMGKTEVLLRLFNRLLWWCVESKNWKEPVGVREVERFLAARQVAGVVWKYPPSVRWFFSRNGFTAEAEALLRREGGLFSDGEQLDALLTTFGLRPLPALRE